MKKTFLLFRKNKVKAFIMIVKAPSLFKYIFVLFFFLTLFLVPSSYAQINISLGNQKTLGGNNTDYGKRIYPLRTGYVALISSESSISSDRTIALKGINDYWLVGLNGSLIPIWQKSFGGNGNDEPSDVIVNHNNDIIMIGLSDSPISGNKTVVNYGFTNIWVICTDSLGTIKWQNVYGGSSGAFYDAKIIQLTNGNYVIGTSSFSGISGTKTEANRGNADYWIFCIDSLGNQIWDKTIGGSRYDILTDLVQVSENVVVIVGNSNSPISGDKTQDTISFGNDHLDPHLGRDVWVVKYNFVSKNIEWDRTLGGNDEDGVYSAIAYDGSAIYVAASSPSNISGTKTDSSFGGNDIWINKLDTSGNMIWDKVYGGSKYDSPNTVQFIGNESLLIGGISNSPISGNKTENSIGPSNYYSDYWVLSIDTTGTMIWDKTIGGNSGEALSSIYVASKNDFFIMGSSTSRVTGDKTEDIRGSTINGQRKMDVWIVELTTSVSFDELKGYNIGVWIFPNPTTGKLSINIEDVNNKIVYVNIFSIEGSLISNKQINANQVTIDVSNLSLGIYIIEGQTTTGAFFRRKFIKN